MADASTKVLVVGAGIAGPVLSIFLKSKGYDPVIYERTDGPISDAGLSLCLQPNGLLVLNKVPGLVESIDGRSIDFFGFYSVLPEDKGTLAESDIPKVLREHRGVGLVGVRRAAFHQTLVHAAEKAGIPIMWGHKLVGLSQGDDYVTVKFENGSEATGSFVIGCDGLHSNTRTSLFGEEKADFTGLVQTGGICTIPESLKSTPPMVRNVFGHAAHMVMYPINGTQCSWAATQREPEAKETWKAMNKDGAREFREKTTFASWDYGAGDVVKSTETLIKYGLYDRPELAAWHKGRVCLIGDAAHPTSPHLGQGANQAFEDVGLLVELLDKHNPSSAPPSAAVLEAIFSELEKVRIPRTAALVKQARTQGESRVVDGVEACIKRNAAYREIWKDHDSVAKHMSHIYEDKQ
ncbi:hypothetical protein NM688_g399 [Phlebia brevispora]|uniref:Uncharacterized protein n=1 Tax=Phlebia brevispora TaxID=194682 RepID=A0ACC1TEM4_9APHY|nr:hypothetical protein NM688_g399 [Phlebia brevispora]